MKKLYIIKAGTTFPNTARQFGDFENWTHAALGNTGVETGVVNVEHGDALPAVENCAGAVITGSHAMVTDRLPWSVMLEQWIPALLEAQIPLFGVCYGHQLLARAAGGNVGFHPEGKEIGTVSIELLPGCAEDPLFRTLPKSFLAHTTHSQSVLALPDGATCLAANAHEAHHAFRLGDWAWGVQFHPEYSADIMRSYIEEQTDELSASGLIVKRLTAEVAETPVSAETLRIFGRIVKDRLVNKTPPNTSNASV